MSILNSRFTLNSLIFSLAVGVLFLFYFTLINLSHQLALSDESSRLLEFSESGIKVGALLHELQKERGLSSAAHRETGDFFSKKLVSQRLLTDKRLQEITEIRHPKRKNQERRKSLAILELKSTIPGLRNQIDQGLLSVSQIIDSYTPINRQLLRSIDQGMTSRSNSVSDLTIAYYYLLQIKEFSGIERAILINVFNTGNYGITQSKQLHKVMSEQNVYLNLLSKTISQGRLKSLKQLLADPDVKQVDQVIKRVSELDQRREILEKIIRLLGLLRLNPQQQVDPINDQKNYSINKSQFFDNITRLLEQLDQISEASQVDNNNIKAVRDIIAWYQPQLEIMGAGEDENSFTDRIGSNGKLKYESLLFALIELQLQNNIKIESGFWWRISTSRIDLLRNLELEILQELSAESHLLLEKSQRSLTLNLILFVIVWMIMFLAVRLWLSARNKAHTKLEQSRQTLSMALQGSNAILWDYDLVSNEIRFDDRGAKILGSGTEQIVFGSSELTDRIAPQNRALFEQLMAAHLADDEVRFSLDHRIKHDSGDWVWVHNSGKVTQRNDEGKALRMVGTLIDISERKILQENKRDSDQRLKFHMENSPLAIIEWNIHFKVTFWNRAAEELFGYTAAESRGKHGSFIIVETGGENNNEIWNELLSKSGKKSCLHSNINRAGELLQCEWSNTRLLDENGIVVGVASIIEDITERKQMEQKLSRSQKMEALGNLTGGIAHDYNNTLGVIMGYAEILGKQIENQPQWVKYVEQIYHAGERGAELTRKLLSFVRQRSPQQSRVNINHLIETDADLLRKTLTVSIELNLELATELWQVKLDANAFEDLILNMSINAMHAMPNGGKLTFITANVTLLATGARKLDLKAGEYVCLSIDDTGCGMNVEIQSKIFDPFFSTKGEKGTGLGLSQAYGFLRSSGGVIHVYSELNRGSCFTLYFPRSIDSLDPVSSLDDLAIKDFQGTETILVVDDEIALCELSEEILVSEGYQVFTAYNGEQALEILAHQKVDLILADVIMPQMNGYQLGKEVHQLYPGILICFTSGFEGDFDIADDNISFDGVVIRKPFSANDLLSSIRCQLDRD